MTEVQTPQPETSPAPMASTPVLNVTEIIKESFSFYKRAFPEFIGLSAIHFGVSFLFGMLIGVVVVGGSLGALFFGESLLEEGGAGLISGTLIGGLLLIVIIVIAGVWFISWAQLALMHFILAKDAPLTIKEVFARAKPQILPFLIATFWSGLATFGVFGLTTLVFGLVAVLGIFINSAPLTVVGMLVGLVVAVVAMILTSIWFAFTAWIVASENIQGRKAVALSKAMSADIFGRVFGAFLLTGLLYMITSAAFSLLSSLVLGEYSTYLDSAVDGLFLFPLLLTALGTIYVTLRKARPEILQKEVSTGFVTMLASIGIAFLVALAGALTYVIISVGPDALYQGAIDILTEIENQAGLSETLEEIPTSEEMAQ